MPAISTDTIAEGDIHWIAAGEVILPSADGSPPCPGSFAGWTPLV